MKVREKILLIISIIFIIFLFIFINFQEPPEPKDFVKNKTNVNYSTLLFNYEIVRYPSSVEIKPLEDVNETVLGFVVDPWNINFGIVPSNGSFIKRNIELTNLEEKNIKVILKAYGNISPLIVFSRNNIVLKPKEKVSIDIFSHSKNFEPGNYSGEIDVIAQKGIYNFLSIT
jgi:hypothetical protein